MERIDAEKANEAQLKTTSHQEKRSVDLPAYRKQLEDSESSSARS